MTEWGIDTLFNPGKRHMDEEKRRLQSTREEIGDSSGGRRIDLEGGTVTISRRPKNPPPADAEDADVQDADGEDADGASAADESAEAAVEDQAADDADDADTKLKAEDAAAEADRSASGE